MLLQPGPPRAPFDPWSSCDTRKAVGGSRRTYPSEPAKKHHHSERKHFRPSAAQKKAREWRAALQAVVTFYDRLGESLSLHDTEPTERFLEAVDAARKMLGWEKPPEIQVDPNAKPPWED